MPLASRNLLGLDGMSKEDIQLILDTAISFREVLDRPIKKVPTLQGKTIVNLFFESSTRTRSEEHTSELQSRLHLVWRRLLEKKSSGTSGPGTRWSAAGRRAGRPPSRLA